tara:strand:- start:269 stop:445 length:177 start_codon:yes stop_codon:yes gene_type:complete
VSASTFAITTPSAFRVALFFAAGSNEFTIDLAWRDFEQKGSTFGLTDDDSTSKQAVDY